jgi:NADH:ubiquinone reductase (H+-translocating)
MTFVVVGAGPTGVEMAGAMAEIARRSLRHDFRRIDPSGARIILVEGTDRVLPFYPERLSERTRRDLERLGVEVRTGTLVTDITPRAVTAGDEVIPTRTVVWAAGVRASALGAALGAGTDRAGRVEVRQDLTVAGHPDVFVIGDLAAARDAAGDELPALAPVAKQQGEHVARVISGRLRGEAVPHFRYRDRGSMATIGRGKAVAQLRGLQITGLVAWLAWLFVHIAFLIGFRNRLVVLVQWAWSYLTWQRGARLITGDRPDLPPPPASRP